MNVEQIKLNNYLFSCSIVLPNGHVCDWKQDNIMHRPVEENCPYPDYHHEFKMRFGSEVKKENVNV